MAPIRDWFPVIPSWKQRGGKLSRPARRTARCCAPRRLQGTWPVSPSHPFVLVLLLVLGGSRGQGQRWPKHLSSIVAWGKRLPNRRQRWAEHRSLAGFCPFLLFAHFCLLPYVPNQCCLWRLAYKVHILIWIILLHDNFSLYQ